MWGLDYKESWASKNWRFWTVVLEKTLESPLGCKEIQPVNPKGYQSWVFIGRADIEAEMPILNYPMQRPSSGSFLMSRLFESGGQKSGASASASVLPMNIQDWFPLGLACLISLQFKGLSNVFSNTTVQKHQFFSTQPFLWVNSHIRTWLLEKPKLWLDTSLPAF